MWRAKALFAKGGQGNSALQAEWLLRAGDVQDAHSVLCTIVGPTAVIEQDYGRLSDLLQWFTKYRVEGWEQGGQVYVDFLRLLRRPVGRRQRGEIETSIQKLERSLANMQEDSDRAKSLEQRVAVIEIDRVLQESIREHGNSDADRVMADAEGFMNGGGIQDDMLRTYQQAMGMAV